jgi:NhaA family Na+:H+ antiporter
MPDAQPHGKSRPESAAACVHPASATCYPAEIVSREPAPNRLISLVTSGNFLLLVGAVIAFAWANSPWAASYAALLETRLRLGPVGSPLDLPLITWVNDGLMVLFFLLVGLELKKEIVHGELSQPRKAMLAIFGALGGMLVPAAIYALFNHGGPAAHGWGIPMATDIAFALACLSILGSRIPLGIRVFVTALAIVDDLGAIVVIALFYSEGLNLMALALVAGLTVLALILNRRGVRSLVPFLLIGLGIWYCLLLSGVHASIGGVLLAFTIPLSNRVSSREPARLERYGPVERLGLALGPWVRRLVLPVFALFNVGLALTGVTFGSAALGVYLGLVAGKPAGIMLFTWLGVLVGLALLPKGVTWRHMLGAGALAGLGFTMSLFIAGLAFNNPALFDEARLGILLGSVTAAVLGIILLLSAPKAPAEQA